MNTTGIKLVVCDLDNTLLHSDKTISQASKKYLIHLQQRGLTLVLATGRFLNETQPYIDELQLKKYHGYAVTANGSQVHDIAADKTYSFEMIKKKEADELLRDGKQHHLIMYVNQGDQYFCECPGYMVPLYHIACFFSPLLKYLLGRKGTYIFYRLKSLTLTKDVAAHVFGELHKICYISLTGKLPDFITHIKKTYPGKYHFFEVNKVATELSHTGVSKKHAVEYICSLNHLNLSNIIAFGDGGNDEALLASAGIGVTMKNASASTLAKAKHVSNKTNNEDGVIDFLREHRIG